MPEIDFSRYRLATGQIVGRGLGLPVTMDDSEGWIAGQHDGEAVWVAPDLSVLDRPVSPTPTLTGNVLTFAGLPGETLVKVFIDDWDNPAEFTVTETNVDGGITFEDPGLYHVLVRPPFPWTQFDLLDVEVL